MSEKKTDQNVKNKDIADTDLRDKVSENQNNINENRSRIRGIYVVMGIMCAAIVGLLVAVIILVAKVKENDKEIQDIYSKTVLGEALADAEKGTGETDVSKAPAVTDPNEITAPTLSKDQYFINYVVNGRRFYVPLTYSCMYRDGVGVIITMNDIFQMKVTAGDTPYANLVADTSVLTGKVSDIGGKDISAVNTRLVNGRSYTYFRFNYEEESNFVAYGETSDGKCHTGGQIVVYNKDMTDEELLILFDSVASTEERTLEEDTSKEDLAMQNAAIKVPFKEDNTISFAGITVEYNVPTNVMLSDSFAYDSYSCDIYQNEDTLASVLVVNTKEEASASDYVISKITAVSDNEVIEPLKEMVDGRDVYYYIENKKSSSGGQDQRMVAACVLSEKTIFTVEYNVYSGSESVTFDDVKDFFDMNITEE